MEDPTTPAPVIVQSTVPSRSWLRNPSIKTLLIASILLFVVVSLFQMLMARSLITFIFSTHGTRVETVEKGTPVWYQLSFGMAKKVAGAPGFDAAPVTILEAVSYGAEGDHAVLARIPGVEGIALGILHANNTFENILADGTEKADLAVRPDGMALYAAMTDGESHLMQFDLARSSEAPSDLGRGRSPRLFTDGFFVAISEKGIVRIDPASKVTSVLVPSSDADMHNGTISRDGTTASISNTSSKTLFYTIERTSPGTVALASTARFTPLAPISFMGNGFFVEPGPRMMSAYEISPAFTKLLDLRIK